MVKMSAKYYPGWHAVLKGNTIHLNGETVDVPEGTFVYPSYSQGAWNSYNSVIIVLETGLLPHPLMGIQVDGKPLSRSVSPSLTSPRIVMLAYGGGLRAGYKGMDTKNGSLLGIIPMNSKCIIQVGDFATKPASIVVNRRQIQVE